jgi:hypothetical protein
MSKYEPRWYASPIDLDERTCGEICVAHRTVCAGELLPVVGMRQAALRGLRPVNARLPYDLRVHELRSGEHGVWMTDLPEELNQVEEAVFNVEPCGDVLIGGLGLGILASAVVAQDDVKSVEVVEINPDVIELCDVGWGYAITCADIARYLHDCDHYDTYMLDTWQGTSEDTWWSMVMPLRRTIRRRFGERPKVWCWAEDIIMPQVVSSLTVGKNLWYYEDLPRMSVREARAFVCNVGLPAWERRYGGIVDTAVAAMEERRVRRAEVADVGPNERAVRKRT